MTRYRGYYWDAQVGRYISRWTGKPILESTIRRAGRRYVAEAIIPNMKDIAAQYFAGKIDIVDFQRLVMFQYKSAWIVNAMLGRGGRSMMTQSDWGKIGYWIRTENQHFYNLLLDLKAGNLSLAQLNQRLEYYARASELAYWKMIEMAKFMAGMTEEHRFTNPLVDNCDACIEYENMGWQPLGSLPAPKTECSCMRNCQCYKEYR